MMERVTFRMPARQVEEVEEMVDEGQFPSRSEALRTAVREMLKNRNRRVGRAKKDNRGQPWRPGE